MKNLSQEKLLETLKGMVKELSDENGNFLAYCNEYERAHLYETYQEAKNFADKGGYVLVIDKEKVYTYKDKTDDEYFEYIGREVRYNDYCRMNRLGL